MSNAGVLYVKSADESYQDRQYRCRVSSVLTGQVFTSSTAGRLMIEDGQSNQYSLISLIRHLTKQRTLY